LNERTKEKRETHKKTTKKGPGRYFGPRVTPGIPQFKFNSKDYYWRYLLIVIILIGVSNRMTKEGL
jgi:hypothetical protein